MGARCRLASWSALTLLLAASPGRAIQEAADGGAGRWPAQRPEFQAVAERLLAGSNAFLGAGQTSKLERRLERGLLSPEAEAALRSELAMEYLRLGRAEQATENIEAAIAVAAGAGVVRSLSQLRLNRALICLRRAELENCVARHNADCCLLPIRGDGVHAEPAFARAARADLEILLEQMPEDLTLRWLLNISAMAAGEWPDGIEERWRIPASAFESQGEFQRLVDVAPSLGMDALNLCGGALVEDLDGDSRLDVVTSTSDPAGSLRYFWNDGRGGFEDRSVSSRLDDQLGGLNLIGADYDSDGDTDLLVMRGAWLFEDGRIRNSLLRNDGGVFRDVTREVGLAEPACPSQAACFGDFDGDGDLDLYVGNEARPTTPSRVDDYPSQLFLNGGAGRFVERARASGVTNDLYAKGVCAGDYDNDGDLDLYVSNIGDNRLYRNDGRALFEDVAAKLDVASPRGRSFACWFFDVQNDGWLDLFVAAYEATLADICADHLGLEHSALEPCLYINREGSFRDEAAGYGIARPFLPMGANFGDLDHDGWLDVYLATGDPRFSTLVPNAMLRNDAGAGFLDVTTAAGLGHLQKGHGVAFGDLDDDGDQDLYHQLGGFFPGDRYQNALFRNPGGGGRFLYLRLVGKQTNRSAVGARLKLVVKTGDGERELHRAVGAVSSFGGSTLRQEVGLGQASAIKRLEVWWPTSGTRQVFEDLPLDSFLRVTEGAEGYELLPLAPQTLGEPVPRER